VNRTDLRVILVEDDPALRELLRLAVGGAEGLAVVGDAPTISSAVDLINTELPDVLVLDLSLPDGTGAQLIGLPTSRPAAVVILTGEPQFDIEDLLRRGAQVVLPKPSSTGSLISAIWTAERRAALGEQPSLEARMAHERVFILQRAANALANSNLETLNVLIRQLIITLGTADLHEALPILQHLREHLYETNRSEADIREAMTHASEELRQLASMFRTST
jgi:DNA-binding NarL/FixJ family response regulator